VPKVSNFALRLRKHDFETGECEYCKYFQRLTSCKVLVGPVEAEKVCDAFQGGGKFKRYRVAQKDIEAFGQGMRTSQPYQHKVIKTLETPAGWLVIIEDTMKPKPHRFSLPIDFHMEHTAREHHWTQKEVDGLIRSGRKWVKR
jgi:hypothetical protein